MLGSLILKALFVVIAIADSKVHAVDLDGDPLLKGDASSPGLVIDSAAEKSKSVTVKPGKMKVLRPHTSNSTTPATEATQPKAQASEPEEDNDTNNTQHSWEAEYHDVDELLLDYNIRLNPMGLLARALSQVSLGQRIGLLHVALDFNIFESLTLGPLFSAAVLGIGNETTNSINVGVRLNYYFSGRSFSTGWVVGPQIEYTFGRNFDSSLQQTVESLSFAAMGGYHWVWPSGFNILTTIGISAARDGLSIYPEVCFGYAF